MYQPMENTDVKYNLVDGIQFMKKISWKPNIFQKTLTSWNRTAKIDKI